MVEANTAAWGLPWPAHGIVYRDGARSVTAGALSQLVQRLAERLPGPTPGSQVAFAFEHHLLAYLVALLATWQRGHAVALPVDARRPAVGLVLARPEVVAFVHDTGAGRGLCVPDLLDAWLAEVAANEPAAAAWSPPGGAVVHYTPTGRETLQAECRDAEQLRAECHALQQRWPLAAGQWLAHACRPGNPEALVPGVLWPLSVAVGLRGGLGSEALPDRTLAELWLGTTPYWQAVSRRGAAAPLRGEEAAPLALALGDPIDAASRQRLLAAGIPLHALAPTGADDPAAAALATAAYAQGAADVALLRRQVTGEVAPRLFGLVVPPAGAGLPWLERLPVPAGEVLPPVLTTVAAVPRCADGRVAPAVLLQALDRLPDARLPIRQLQFTVVSSIAVPTAAGHVATTVVPPDYYAFFGHFDGYPVLSGAVQLHDLVLPVLRAWLGPAAQPAQFADLKFLARIGPGDAVEVRMQPAANNRGVEFAIHKAGQRCTSGRLVLREGGVA